MSLWTNMYIGVTGLKTQQNAINITAHNLTNVNTEGYVRQQASFSDLSYRQVGFVSGVATWQTGYGVESDRTRHIRDLFLDASYREEYGREAFYDVQYDATVEIEDLFGELEGETFQQTLLNFQEALEELAKTPEASDLATRSGVVLYAEEFISRANAIYEDLVTYQTELDNQVKSMVDQINSLGEQIVYYNDLIRSYEATNVETASDYRDQRDLLLDELSQLVDIDYEENADGVVTVKVEGVNFITEDAVFKMATAQLDTVDHGSSFVTVVWPYLENAEVFNLSATVSTALGNDVGKLKSTLLARGDYVANYTDLPADDATAEEIAIYEKNVAYSSIMKTEAEFDRLINGIVELVNSILCPEVETTLNGTYTTESGETVTYSGETVKILDLDNCSYGTDENSTPGTELFSRSDAERYTVLYDSSGEKIYVYNEVNEFGTTSLYTLGNLEVNQTLLENYAYLPLTTASGDADYDRTRQLVDLFDVEFDNLNPENTTNKTFMEYYESMINEIANEGTLYKAMYDNQNTVVSNLDNSREAFYGVSSDEELTALIKYQDAYMANSRYINVISEMLENIIERMGV